MVKRTVKSFSQLETVLLQIICDCINEVAEKANKLLREHVDTDVYGAVTRTYYYDGSASPTGQLRESITTKKAIIKGNQVEAEIYHDSDKMEYDPDTYLHGSRYYSPNDVRDMLPYFIDQGKTGSLFGPAWEAIKRPYITNTKTELSDGLLDRWMIEALKKRGIKTSVKVELG